MTIAPEVQERSLRQELTAFVEDVLQREDVVSVEKLVRMAHRHFNGDVWIREALIRQGLNSMIPAIAGEVRHQLRRQAREMHTAETRRERIASVFEHVGYGITKSVLTLTRPEHLYVALERRTAAAGFLRHADFHDAVALLHSDDNTPTGALPKEKLMEVESLWKKYIEKDD